MKAYQKDFIQFCLKNKVLRFGEFVLKSGRISPYFFNAGMFHDGEAFHRVGLAYANAIAENFLNQFDILFGPAYKGIALSTAASIGLLTNHHLNVPVSFNRKEVKDHGEGGLVIGSELKAKRILLIDDVISAGVTVRESAALVQKQAGHLIGMMIALDRQERGLKSDLSATQEVEKEFKIKVASIITFENLVTYLEKHSEKIESDHLEAMLAYREQYGAVKL